MPATPWTAKTSTESSMPWRFFQVMPTRPAMMPVARPSRVGLPSPQPLHDDEAEHAAGRRGDGIDHDVDGQEIRATGGAAYEVVHADLVGQPTTHGPGTVEGEHPVGERGVDQRGPQGTEDQPGAELHAPRGIRGDECERDGGEEDVEPSPEQATRAVIGDQGVEARELQRVADQPEAAERIPMTSPWP